MKLGFVFQKDSHLKAVQATALRLGNQYQGAISQFYAIDTDIQAQKIAKLDIVCLTAQELSLLQECDYLVCCLGGYLLNKVIAHFAHTSTKVISLFPGVVSHYQLDAFISRFNADQVWLNCQADYKFYTRLCRIFGVKNNGVLYGISWFFDNNNVIKDWQNTSNPATIFFEQTQIISSASIAQRIEKQLIKIIKNQPNKPFIYKMRQNIHNEYLVQIRQNLMVFDNVCVCDYLSDDDIRLADRYVSVSSSAIIEGLLLGKKCHLLNQKYLDMDSGEIFVGSGLFLGDKGVNQVWLTNRVQMPVSQVVLSEINKTSYTKFAQKNYLNIRLYLVRLAYYYPKMLKLLLHKQKLNAIQKSLEYL